MKERQISEQEINDFLSSPEIIYPGKRGEMNAIRTVKQGRKIRITYVAEGKNKIVITAIVLD